MRWHVWLVILVAAAAVAGCSGGGSSTTPPQGPPAARAEGSMALLITDAASDRCSSVSLELTEVTLISTEMGETENLLGEPVQLELLSLSGHQALIALVPVASGPYAAVRVALDPSSVRARDLDGNPVTLNVTRATASTSLEGLAFGITHGGSARLRIDISADQSLVDHDGELEFALAISADDPDGDVEVEGVHGRVLEERPDQGRMTLEIRTSDASETAAGILDVVIDDATVLLSDSGQPFPDAGTFFAAEEVGTMVHAHGHLQQDGSLLAASIEIAESEPQLAATGVVMALDPDARLLALRLTQVDDHASGLRDQIAPGGALTVAWDGATVFVRHTRTGDGSLPDERVNIASEPGEDPGGHAPDPSSEPMVGDRQHGDAGGRHAEEQHEAGEETESDPAAEPDLPPPGDDRPQQHPRPHGAATANDLRVGQCVTVDVRAGDASDPELPRPLAVAAPPAEPVVRARRIEIIEELPAFEGRIVATAGLPDRIVVHLAPRDPAISGGLAGPDDDIQVTLAGVAHIALRADGDPEVGAEALRPGRSVWLRGAWRVDAEIPTIDATLLRVKPGELHGELTDLDPFTHTAVIAIDKAEGFADEPLRNPVLAWLPSASEFRGDATSEHDLARRLAEHHGSERFLVAAVGLGDGFGGVSLYRILVAEVGLSAR
ncbi:MAG: DUF4382 domain-containing protein [Planctomycetota bacterium]